MRRHRDGDALSRAVEMVAIYTELDDLVRETAGLPQRQHRALPGEAIHRAVCENA